MPCDIAGASHHENASFKPCQSYLSAYAVYGEKAAGRDAGAYLQTSKISEIITDRCLLPVYGEKMAAAR